MSDLLRDSALGYVVRHVTRSRAFQYLEDREDFELPTTYLEEHNISRTRTATSRKEAAAGANIDEIIEDEKTTNDLSPDSESEDAVAAEDVCFGPMLEKVTSQADLERAVTAATMKPTGTKLIVPTRTKEGIILVDWYTTDDPANPQNWSDTKKAFVSLIICLYTLSVYLGSAIYTPSEPFIIDIFGVSPSVAALGLSLYVLGYGTGPLLFSPLSEIPRVGRSPVYIFTFAIFVILIVPTALVNNIGGLLVLRFLLGFFGSPSLANGGASLFDMYDIFHVPFLMVAWTAAATCGPSLGPTIAGFSVVAENWHWSQWEMLWLAGPVYVLMFLCLPETSSNNILLRRAARLRRVTGNSNYLSQSEINQSKLTASKIVIDALWKPMQITFEDFAVGYATVYTALAYGIYYSFFEAFPIVYGEIYGFELPEIGLVFLSIVVSVIIGIVIYCSYVYFVVNPRIRAHGLGPPEDRLVPALVASFLIPVGLFLFAWTSRANIHWIVSAIGVTIYCTGVLVVFQCIFLYVPLSYPQYAASLFAANDFARSALSCGAILFARPLFINLGIGRGVSVLAGLTVGGVFGIFALWHYGAYLRSISKFTAK